MSTGYGTDLAFIHDAGFGGLARGAAAFVRDLLRQRGHQAGLITDLGCGSGILAHELTTNGFEVLGIDQSDAMLALAREQAPQAHFRRESLWQASIPPCLAVTAIGECLNYLFDDTTAPSSLEKLFRRIHDALLPGGVFVFDVAEPGRIPEPGTIKVHTEGPTWAVLMTAVEDRAARLLTRNITSFRQVGDLFRRDREVHRLRLLPHVEVTALLEQVGFGVEGLTGYDNKPFVPGHVGFVALSGG